MDDDDDVEVISAEAELVAVVPGPGELTGTVHTDQGALPALRTAAVAATGFLAGAATVALLRRAGAGRHMAELAERRGTHQRARGTHPQFPVMSSRTYLVTVRTISRP